MILQIISQEWFILIIAIIILFFGIKRLPELAKSLGKISNEFKKGQLESKKELEEK